MTQSQLFGPSREAVPAKPSREPRRLDVLITVKAAPNPSATYGETVCVAGISADVAAPGWIRLYPINFRYLDQEQKFKKYDIVSVQARPSTGDYRAESWRPNLDSLTVVRHLDGWKRRRPWLDPYIDATMCELYRQACADAHARSLGLVRAADVSDVDIERHGGWNEDEQRKIDGYVSQLTLFGDENRAALQAPRFKGYYKWRCTDPSCNGHRQGIIDWEFVAHQRKLSMLGDDDARAALRKRWLEELCRPTNEVSFYVGNQHKRAQTFSILGVYYPKLTS